MAKYKVKIKDGRLVVRVRLSIKEKLNARQLEFFSGKSMRGLLKATVKKLKLVEYSGPVAISLYERLKKPVSRYEFYFIMEQIVDTVQKLNMNALIIANLVLNIRNVYINETTKELQFIYLPLEERQREVNIIAFMEEIIYACTLLPEKDTDYVSRFVYFINSLNRFEAERIEQYIQKEDKSVVTTIKRHNVGQSGYITDKQADYYKHYAEKEDDDADLQEEGTVALSDPGTDASEEATGLLIDEDTVLLEEGATGLLKGRPAFTGPALYRCSTNEVIAINKSVFRIGMERSHSDYYVSNNDMVSRKHADIIVRGSRFYIVDLNSRNGTFVNGKQLPAQQEIEIHYGDKIQLADEDFEFRR